MKKKGRLNPSVQEGIFFFLVGAALLGYAVASYGKAFNKNWGQSPYLFPLMVAAAFMALALCLIKEGLVSGKRTSEEERPAGGNKEKRLADGNSEDGNNEENLADGNNEENLAAGTKEADGPGRKAENWKGVAVVLVLCALYYAALAYAKIPYITVGIFTFFFTFSTFEVATLIFLAVMMAYMGVRKPLILASVPLGFTLFLSVAFRTMLNVLLP